MVYVKLSSMMLFFLMLLGFYSSNIHAFPQEGDHARYEARYQGKTYEMKKSIIGYYADKDSYLVASKVSLNGEILDESLNELSSSWLYTPSKIENVLKTCVRREGALETLKISGKSVQVCSFYNEDAQMDYSIGMVPFGQVRFQHYLGGGEFLDFYLVDFH